MSTLTAGPGPGRRKRLAVRMLGWLLAIGLSGLLNLFLFGIMPGLVRRAPAPPEDLEEIQSVRVVRIKRPETPPRKKEKIPPPKPEVPPKQARKLSRMQAPVPARVRPRLPFELNPKLPEFSNSLTMPPLSSFSMDTRTPRGLYMPGDLDGPLTALSRVPAIYPLRARRLGIQGWVKVAFTVTAEGMVEDIRVVKAEPEGIFERAVTECVAQWRFKPGTMAGTPVAARAETVLKFTLE